MLTARLTPWCLRNALCGLICLWESPCTDNTLEEVVGEVGDRLEAAGLGVALELRFRTKEGSWSPSAWRSGCGRCLLMCESVEVASTYFLLGALLPLWVTSSRLRAERQEWVQKLQQPRPQRDLCAPEPKCS